jgi:succinate dehydrogenase / fumarate reductase cytochrome b subunit
MITNTQRPKFLNLLKIHLPVTGVTSFAHRVTGAILFLSLPFAVYLFTLSLQSQDDYHLAIQYLTTPWAKLVSLLLIWSGLHHLFAGIRFLLLDIQIGGSLVSARRSAWVVNFAGVIVFILIAVWVMA